MSGHGSNDRGNLFVRLGLSMLGLGLFVGIAFPLVVPVLIDGVHASVGFWAFCVVAGLTVGGFNYLLFHVVISRVLSRTAARMTTVGDRLVPAGHSAAPSHEDEHVTIEVSSSDAIGAMQIVFNRVIMRVARQLRTDRSLAELQEALTSAEDMQATCRVLYETIAKTVHASAGVVYVLDGELLTPAFSHGVDAKYALPVLEQPSHAACWLAVNEGTPREYTLDEDDRSWFLTETPLGLLGPKRLYLSPVLSRGRAVALVVLVLPTDGEDLAHLEAIQKTAGAYVESAKLYARLHEVAAYDELTGLLNRRFGMRRAHEEFERARRQSDPFALLLFDLDHFKHVNDTYGHDAGDAVLRSVANEVTQSLRASDVCCRYGGEEFIVIASSTPPSGAVQLAERLLRTVSTLEVKHGDHRLSVTISIGVACWPSHPARSSEEMITIADKALYQAKDTGRDRAVLAALPAPTRDPATDLNAATLTE